MLRWLIKFGGYTTILRVIAIGVSLAFVSALSLWMPKDDYGLLAMVVSVATLAAAIAGFGQAELAVREVSPLVAREETEQAQAYLHEAYGLVLAVSVLTGAAIGAYFLIAGYSASVAGSAGLITSLLGINLVLSGAARSQDRYFLAFAPKDILWRGAAILATGALFFGGFSTTIDVVAPLCAVVLLVIVGGQAARLSFSPRKLMGSIANSFGGERMGAGAALMFSAVALTAMNTVDVFLVGERMSPTVAAEYFPANRIALMCGFFLLPMQMVIMPRIAVMMRENDMPGVRKLFTYATLLIGAASIVTGAVLVFAYPLYAPLFGTASGATRESLTILVAGYAIGGLFGLPGIILITAKRQKLLALVNIGCALCAVAALILVTGTGGLSAVAYTVAGFELLRKILIALSAYLAAGVAPFSFSSFSTNRVS